MKISVIGAGLGGLAAAARLQANGHAVTIYEQGIRAGGRANVVELNGFKFDTGPTLLMMPDVIEQLFADCGRKLSDYLQLIRLDCNYRVSFEDGSQIDVSPDLAKFAPELAQFDQRAPQQFSSFLADLAELYDLSRDRYIDRNFDRLTDFLTPQTLAGLIKRGGLRRLSRFVGSYFDDPKLVQLFSFQSVYLGLPPDLAPALYAMIVYLEIGQGIYFPHGGFHHLPLALARLFGDLGGQINYQSPIERIIVKNNQAIGLKLANGETILSDVVISNADLTYTYNRLLQPNERRHFSNRKLERLKHSNSAYLFFWGVNHPLTNLQHHNLILNDDFSYQATQIFRGQLASKPSFYINVATKTEPDLAPSGRQTISILVPVPNLRAELDWPSVQIGLKHHILKLLKQRFGTDLNDRIETEAVFSPGDFESQYNLWVGSAFGLVHSFLQSGYFRPHNHVKGVKGLYLVGASTYPGNGIPMVILGGKLVAARIALDYAGT